MHTKISQHWNFAKLQFFTGFRSQPCLASCLDLLNFGVDFLWFCCLSVQEGSIFCEGLVTLTKPWGNNTHTEVGNLSGEHDYFWRGFVLQPRKLFMSTDYGNQLTGSKK